MKTAISLPGDLFKSGDALARRLGVSRSELCARALAELVARHKASELTQRLNASEFTQRLNAVYADRDSQLEPSVIAAQSRVLATERC